ncbi:Congested-like trachea protein [Gryllus bimaculatus]|nr:Congested-like trachea protein [Gryllus bimaculatus]
MALDFVAGCVGGCAGVLVGHPFDTIKVHLQTQDALRPIYRGTFHCMQTIVQKESVRGLYRGMTSPLCGVALINAVVFGVYGNVQRRMSEPDALCTHFYAGAAAGVAQSFICSPIELAKTRIQVQMSRGAAGGEVARGPLQCLVRVARVEGARGVWRGLGATAARDSSGVAVYFVTYEWLARAMAPGGDQPLSTGRVLLAGGLAGTVSWISSFPVDVVKSRLQVDGMDGPRRYSGFWDCCRQSVRAEGLSFLGRGLTSTVLRAFPMNAATFAVVTWVFRLAGPQGEAERPPPRVGPRPDAANALPFWARALLLARRTRCRGSAGRPEAAGRAGGRAARPRRGPAAASFQAHVPRAAAATPPAPRPPPPPPPTSSPSVAHAGPHHDADKSAVEEQVAAASAPRGRRRGRRRQRRPAPYDP